MRITKIGHSCLVVEDGTAKILVDPGVWTELPALTGLHAVLITHEHADHFDIEKIKQLVLQNQGVQLISHPAVGALLHDAGYTFTSIEPGESVTVQDVQIESYGTDHASIYGDTVPCRNTGYLIAGRLFMPGDALHDIPQKKVDVLALPTGGPWMKMGEAIAYAKAVAPTVVFPIHDAMYTEDFRTTFVPRFMNSFLPSEIKFKNLVPGESLDLS